MEEEDGPMDFRFATWTGVAMGVGVGNDGQPADQAAVLLQFAVNRLG